jgi:hypothetical protein
VTFAVGGTDPFDAVGRTCFYSILWGNYAAGSYEEVGYKTVEEPSLVGVEELGVLRLKAVKAHLQEME